MRDIDIYLTTYVNSFVGRWELFDLVFVSFNRLEIFKGAVVAGLLFYSWFTADRRLSGSKFLRSVFGVFAAIILARSLQLYLPHSLRPIHDPAIDFTLPEGIGRGVLVGWSSFPSDHAVLFVAASTAVFFANRKLGIVAYLWTFVFTILPRLYAGLHWPSDLLGGAVLGGLVMWWAYLIPLPASIGTTFRRWEEYYPASLNVIAFLMAFQIATLFEDARKIFRIVVDAVQ